LSVSSHFQYLLLGTGSGAVIAALGLGMVLTYRASGVVNFAHAAMGVFLAYTYGALRQSGELLNPLLIGPSRIRLLPGDCTPEGPAAECFYRFSTGTAFALTMLLACAYGLLVHLLVFRPLRHAPTLAKLVGSLGLFLYLLAITNLRVGTQGAVLSLPEPILPDGVVSVLGADLQQDRLWLAGLVLVTTAVLVWVYHHTRFGLATEAAAESEKGAVLVGIDTDRVAAGNWMLATVLAGAAVILFAPITSINPTTTALLFVPALAAALLGSFRSFTITALAGLGIGMAQSEIQNVQVGVDWLPDVDLQQALPFVVIVATMVLRGESLPTRGSFVTGHLPRSPSPRNVAVWAAALAAAGGLALLVLDAAWRGAVIVSTTTALVALSIVLLTGYVGQISLMPMALAGASAFAMVKLTADWGVPFPLSPLLAALGAVALGVLAGAPAVRLRGMNLAITTLAAAVAIEELLLRWDAFTGGPAGSRVPPPELLGVDLGISAPGAEDNRAAFGLLCVGALVAVAVVVAHLRRGRSGLRWLGVRANERAAAAAGVPVAREKLVAFALSSFIAGLGGAVYAYGHPNLSADSFRVVSSLSLLALTYLGGIASVVGALVAGLLADGGILSVGRQGSQVQFAVSGLALIAVAALYPDGLSGAAYRLAGRARRALGTARRAQAGVG
jgi:ABC-type branched-subunit amino acid transport system permease subunit